MGGWTEKDRKREHVERDVDDDDGGTCVCPDLASLPIEIIVPFHPHFISSGIPVSAMKTTNAEEERRSVGWLVGCLAGWL